MSLLLQAVLKALLQDRKAAETPKEVRAATFPFAVRAWARLKALILLILLLYTIPGDPPSHIQLSLPHFLTCWTALASLHRCMPV